MNADGSGQTRLTNNSASDYSPAWSPNGTKIAFQSDRDGDAEIYVMDTDGSNQTRLTNNSYHGGGYEPTWSPDSRKIAFDSCPNGYYEIYVMNADGSGQTALTSDGSVDKAVPDWYGPAVSSITPKSGRRGTTVKITNLTGKSFATGAKVSLVKGAKTIPGKAVTWVSLSRLKCNFAIPGTAPTGKWSVRVTNPGSVAATLAKAFTVKA
jgi:dipeptidyl aminopeptidase/acylaminoacyl peptidase